MTTIIPANTQIICLDTLQAFQGDDSKRHQSIPSPSLQLLPCHSDTRQEKRCVLGDGQRDSRPALPSVNHLGSVSLGQVCEQTDLTAQEVADFSNDLGA
jgi:hypothetical protein